MEQKTYKYIVTIDTTAWDNSLQETIEEKSTYRQIEISKDDPFVARKIALEEAKRIEEFFEDKTQPHSLPPIKWLESFTNSEQLFWMFYQIKIEFEIDENTYCIFNNGEPGPYVDELLEGLQKEYEILKNIGIDTNAMTETVKYYDCKDNQYKQTRIFSHSTSAPRLTAPCLSCFRLSSAIPLSWRYAANSGIAGRNLSHNRPQNR